MCKYRAVANVMLAKRKTNTHTKTYYCYRQAMVAFLFSVCLIVCLLWNRQHDQRTRMPGTYARARMRTCTVLIGLTALCDVYGDAIDCTRLMPTTSRTRAPTHAERKVKPPLRMAKESTHARLAATSAKQPNILHAKTVYQVYTHMQRHTQRQHAKTCLTGFAMRCTALPVCTLYCLLR